MLAGPVSRGVLNITHLSLSMMCRMSMVSRHGHSFPMSEEWSRSVDTPPVDTVLVLCLISAGRPGGIGMGPGWFDLRTLLDALLLQKTLMVLWDPLGYSWVHEYIVSRVADKSSAPGALA